VFLGGVGFEPANWVVENFNTAAPIELTDVRSIEPHDLCRCHENDDNRYLVGNYLLDETLTVFVRSSQEVQVSRTGRQIKGLQIPSQCYGCCILLKRQQETSASKKSDDILPRISSPFWHCVFDGRNCLPQRNDRSTWHKAGLGLELSYLWAARDSDPRPSGYKAAKSHLRAFPS